MRSRSAWLKRRRSAVLGRYWRNSPHCAQPRLHGQLARLGSGRSPEGGNLYVEALPGVVVFALGGGPLFVAATTAALGRVGLQEAGLVSGVVQTFNQLGAAICVAVASTVAAAGLAGTPSIDGFTDAFTVFTIVAAVAAVVSLRLVPSGTPQMTGAPRAH
jgi:hypothetical protein